MAGTTPAWADPAPGIVAAYSFDEGGGATAADASGNGHTGMVTGATWVPGKYGGALSFNGTDAHVSLGSLGTFYQQAFTLEAWVNKTTATKNDVAVVGSWAGTGPMLWVDHLATRYHLTLGSSMSSYLDSGQSPVAGQWQHLAATYDGTTARFYVDGVEVASRSVSGGVGTSDVWRIGAYGATAGNFFDGLIDNVRIYARALTAAEIETNMDTPVGPGGGPPDTIAPTTPGTLTATGGAGQVALDWGASTDNVGVTRYNVHRSTSAGFAPTSANRVAQPTGTSYTDTLLPAGTYYYKVTAEDAAANLSAESNEASATVSFADITPPTVAVTSPSGGATVSGTVAVTANASDDVAVAGVQFKLDGADLGAEDTVAPYSIDWDTSGALNGAHSLAAVARDGAGNATTSSGVAVTVANGGASSAGIRAAYAFDEGSGTIAPDSSENHKTATLVNAGWTAGKFGSAVSLNGTSSEVDPLALGTFYKSAFTYEAWVRKQSTKMDAAVVGTWTSGQSGGAMIWVHHQSGRYYLTLGASFANYLDSGRSPAVGQWQHVAATYDGAVARFYVDGVETASAPFTGNVGDSNAWRIGAYGSTPAGFFDGAVDNVRIYGRALSGAEIAADMNAGIQPEHTPPTVTTVTPAAGASGVSVGSAVTANFSEPMQSSTISSATFELRDPANALVPATVSYNAATDVATLTPTSALQFGALYRATVKGGGPKDLLGNVLAGDRTWTFTTEGSPPPVLVVASTSNPYGMYLTEILRNEGLNAFTTIDISLMSPALLSKFDVVVLGEMNLSQPQVTALTGWVNTGGNLIAMRPDKKLAGLLGLTTAGGTISNGYIKVATGSAPGAGIVSSTMQFHGTADRYWIASAVTVAPLYTDATTATMYPAVSLRAVGSSGGQAAAFTYDLARSVVYTRQGNPAWAGQERDGVLGIRPDDMFFGAKSGDVQPDWINTSKIAIPQADEQQRLLVNMITMMERDRLPLPRFWYLPNFEKAAVVMSGDDHSSSQVSGGTAVAFDRFKQLSPPGCVVAKWECVRSTSYIYPDGNLTNAQAAAYLADGFEIGLHPVVGFCPANPLSESALGAIFDSQLSQWHAKYTSQPGPVSSRTHCVYWPDWATNAKVELARGIRMDANYYHFPGSWIGTKYGFMNGGGFPMRFADLNGTLIDVYQQNTNLNDEATTQYASAIAALLDNAIGPAGYYGAFGMNMHTDYPDPHVGADAIVAAAQARSVPVISYKQLLDWTDGRNNSTIRGLSWSSGTLTFVTTVANGANGLQTLLPMQGRVGTLRSLSCGGSATPYSVQTIKGVQYAVFTSVAGTCSATYW